MAARFASLRSELLWTFVISLIAATILATGSAFYISRLDAESEGSRTAFRGDSEQHSGVKSNTIPG
jgi:hypothetical protein